MAEETAEEAAQRVNAKRLAANRESKKRKRSEKSKEQRENRLASKKEITKRKRAEKAAQRVNSKRNFSINPKMAKKQPRKLLKEIIRKGLRLLEKVRK